MLTGFAAAVFLFGGLLRVRPAIADAQRRPLCLALLCFGVGSLFDLTPIACPFDAAIDVYNAGDLLAHTFGLVGVYCLLQTLDGLAAHAGTHTSRWLRPFLLAAVASSVVLFAATPMRIETTAFTAQYGAEPTIAAYWAISIAFPTLCLAQLLRTALTNWSAPIPELRVGLRVVTVGVAIGFMYAAAKLAEVVSQVAHGPDLASELHSLDRAALGLGLLLIAGGLTITSPAVSRRVITAWERASGIYLDWRLRWFWRRVCIAASAADTLDTRGSGVDFRLLRKVVELRDGLSNLSSPATTRTASAVSVTSRATQDSKTAALVAALVELDRHGDRTRRVTALDARAEARQLIDYGHEVRKALHTNDR